MGRRPGAGTLIRSPFTHGRRRRARQRLNRFAIRLELFTLQP
jgi:hypothetical protein